MTEKSLRLSQLAKECNIGVSTVSEYLEELGIEEKLRPNTKVSGDYIQKVLEKFAPDKAKKEASEEVVRQKQQEKEAMLREREDSKPEGKREPESIERPTLSGPKMVGKIDLDKAGKPAPAEEKEVEKAEPAPEVKAEEAPAPKEEPTAEKVEEAPIKEEAPKAEEAPKQEEAQAPEPKVEAPKQEEKAAPEAKEEAPKEEPPVESPAPAAEAPKEVKEVKEEPKEGKPVAETPTPEKKEEAPKEEVKAEAPKEEKVEAKAEEKKEEEKKASEGSSDTIKTKYEKLSGPKFTGEKVDLSKFEKKPKKKVASSTDNKDDLKKKRKRKRISTDTNTNSNNQQGNRRDNSNNNRRGRGRKPEPKQELTEEEVQKQIKETLEKLTGGGRKNKGAKLRREKRQERREQDALNEAMQQEEDLVLKVTEFVTVSELATMMNVAPTQVISSCMSLGMMVTLNQRLDAETLTIVAEEFGYQVEFVDSEVSDAIIEEEDKEEDLKPRAPIVTVMGHVDHGKTSLLDYVRKANVIAGESGGITQHIGAYSVELESGQHITFLDTPGHEAFTAMRARGAKITDVAIIVIAADDAVMPQTKEAISHAQAAGVPIVFAINKVDRPTANPEKIKEQLASMNLLVEDWGGKIQSHDISAKTGLGVNELLEKVLLESELLDLKANPDRRSSGAVIEASLDKGRGYLATILVQNGTLRVGDYVLAGQYSGKVKAMLDERGHRLKEAGPARPVNILGLDGAPQAGDGFVVMEDEREAKNIAAKRTQLQREQSARTQKNLTLEEIGRRLAVGDFQELNVIVKGDVDGSIEALSDSLQKLSTEEIQVNIIHKAVGQISESDILLAAASDAIIVGFQVRPSANARKLAEKESVDVRLYSIIYDAINEIRDAMEGMLSPDVKEEVVCNVEIRETFKISKVGTIAGCYVLDGTITRNTNVRIIRDGVVVYTGELASLKRYKDDVKEVKKGFECGLNIKNYNDIKVGDIIEGYEEVEVKKTL
ncbi:translation initiation factor IF-2 [Croceimicrobium hydrocarbonivorans]|uniref:Translation initiation factor IF-2 n=1 Tax=Croceimicrobium hydrocarbonivorans TaxID=2761580 RepID=A0A7H0VAU6_9FLAO|nr:translation initiation factor IF-2 [Croceimicrobium hydrocarbonivorans]QNR22844.1 translation initiation factor IF-2 [Croceimicrobium hydrocarbonivorans]